MTDADAFERAWELLRAGKVDEAKAFFLAHQKKTGTVAECEQAMREGRAHHEAGKRTEAVSRFHRVLDLNPTNAEAHYRLARIAMDEGERDAARTHAEALLLLTPTVAETWGVLIDLAYNDKQYAEAKRIADEGLSRCGEGPFLLEKALACALMLKETSSAITYVERELRLVPDHAQAHLNLARLRLLAADHDGSIAAAKALLDREPKNAEAHFHLGNAYEGLQRTREAAHSYRAALAISPDDWKYATNLAALLVSDGGKAQYEEARALLTAILPRVPPDEWRPAYNLALAHVRLGANTAARELAEQIIRSAKPTDPIAEEARRLIANLEG